MISKSKQTVFLSHSSKNRSELVRLKQLLDSKAIGSLEFFLSSDDESIRLGKPWPEEVYAALKRAKLMFVFISAESLSSGWAYFEAGYGYRHLDRVIPFCLPGIDRGSVPPPLGLLQARNLHREKDLNVLLKVCNETFALKIPESFNRNDFERIFPSKKLSVEPAINWVDQVDQLRVTIKAPPDAVEQLATVCKAKGLDCDETNLFTERSPTLVASGLTLRVEREVSFFEFEERRSSKKQKQEQSQHDFVDYEFELSVELIEVTFSILDRWKEVTKNPHYFWIELRFGIDVVKERKAHELTQRIYGSEISMLSDGTYRFEDADFWFEESPGHHSDLRLAIRWLAPLSSLPIHSLVSRLFALRVLIDLSQPKKNRRR